MTETAALPTYEEFVTRCRAEGAERVRVEVEEFAEPMCFTTEGHRAGVAALR